MNFDREYVVLTWKPTTISQLPEQEFTYVMVLWF
jgi:hypothetical protein